MTISSQFAASQKIVLAKIEGTYGSEPTPTVSANAIEVMDLQVTYPFEVLERNLLHEDMSQTKPLTGKRMAEISFTCELKGGGTRGTPGRLSPLLKSCKMNESAKGGVSVIYNPGSTNYSCTIYVYDVNSTTSGKYLLHKFYGCVGNVEFSFKAGQIATAKFSMKGLYTRPADVDDPGTPAYEATEPVPVKSATLTFGTEAGLIIDEIQIMLGNEVSERPDVNSVNSIKGFVVTARKPTGSINPEQTLIAEKDFFDDLEDKTSMILDLTVGNLSGNTILISGVNLTLDKISLSNRNGLGAFDIPVHFNRTSGNDEFHIKET